MNEVQTDLSKAEFLSIMRALRFSQLALVLCISYVNIQLALGISGFQMVYRDMVGNRPFPPVTTFVIQTRFVLIVLSFALPMLGILSVICCRRSLSLYIIGLVVAAILVQFVFIWQAMISPFFMMLHGWGMQGTQ